MTIYYVINESSLISQQRGQKKIIERLFEILYNATLPDNNDDAEKLGIIPPRFQQHAEYLKESGTKEERVRTTSDIITSLTERQAMLMYERLTGESPGSLKDRIIG